MYQSLIARTNSVSMYLWSWGTNYVIIKIAPWTIYAPTINVVTGFP